jgi:hypothetical protein
VIQVPQNKAAFPTSISCASAGDCTAVGETGGRVFAASESKGRWGKAIEVPGLSSLKGFGDLAEFEVSCGSSGNCEVGGDYIGPRDGVFAFVASERNGVWAKAISVPGLGALNTGRDEELTSLSCSPGGDNCTAGGSYEVGSGSSRGFDAYVVSERNGRWGKATPVPGLNPSQFARIRSVSCASAGNCSGGGSLGGQQGFLVSEKNGTWGKAIVVPGLSALNTGNEAEVDHVSCATVGNCVAGGSYFDTQDNELVWVASEKNGTWGNATTVPGLNALAAGGFADDQALSCTTPGNCAASGTYQGSVAGNFQGWVASEKTGTWGSAIEVPNLGTLNTGGNVQVVLVSCAAPGNCAAGGSFALTDEEGGDTGAFVATEVKGAWGKATAVPGLSALNTGSSVVDALTCAPAGPCVVGGSYVDHSNHIRGFVISQK